MPLSQSRSAEVVKPNIPETWRVITGCLIEAQAAKAVMADPSVPRAARDSATARYVRAADALVAELSVLRQDGTLAAIADFLKSRTS